MTRRPKDRPRKDRPRMPSQIVERAVVCPKCGKRGSLKLRRQAAGTRTDFVVQVFEGFITHSVEPLDDIGFAAFVEGCCLAADDAVELYFHERPVTTLP